MDAREGGMGVEKEAIGMEEGVVIVEGGVRVGVTVGVEVM